MRRLPTSFAALVGCTVLAIACLSGARAAFEQRGPSFRLTDQHGRSVSDTMLSDKPAVLHFGYTHCPVVCPTTLLEIAGRMRDLGAEAQDIHFVFVTVDPQRDTAQLLNSYLTSFDTRIIGLTGSPDQIKALADGIGATFSRQGNVDGGYTIDHSTLGYLMGRGWSRAGTLYMGSDARTERVLASLRRLIGKS